MMDDQQEPLTIEKLTQPGLQNILTERSAAIIKAYRLRKKSILDAYARLVGLDEYIPASIGFLFAKLIKQFHPDNWSKYLEEIRHAFIRNDQTHLEYFAVLFGISGYQSALVERIQWLESDLSEAPYLDPFQEDLPFYHNAKTSHGDSAGEGILFYHDECEEEVKKTFLEVIQDEGWVDFPYDLIDRDEVMSLEELHLNGRGIVDLTYLEFCQNVKDLNLSDNYITDISPLTILSHVETLDISMNAVKNIYPLASMVRLKDLDASSNKIADISSIANLEELIDLNLSNNRIQDIAALIHHPQIKHLDLSYNRLTTIRELVSMPNLKTVNLWGNPVVSMDVIQSLRNNGVKVRMNSIKRNSLS